jgi:type VI secretion system protein VasD
MGQRLTVPMGLIAATLTGCFGAKEEPAPPPPPTKIELRIEAAGDVNPNAQGKGSPVLLRIYELKGLAAFNAADYFALSEKDQTALGADLARKQELMLRPGEKKTLLLQPEDAAGYFAAYAGFRSLNAARWRVSAPIPAHATSIFELKLTGTQMALSTPPAPQPEDADSKPASEDSKK